MSGRDWPAIIRQQRDLANIKGKVVTAMLSDVGASVETLCRLHRDVERLARHFDSNFLEMSEELGLEGPIIDSAMAVEGLWSSMSVQVADRTRSLKGIEDHREEAEKHLA